MELILLIIVCLGSWFWLDTLTARDKAVVLGQELAEKFSLQLLDETVACTKLRLARNLRGHVQMLRTYEFEVSANGVDRMQCNLILLGRQLHTWHIPPYVQPLY